MELKINHSAVKELAEILKETGLTEIEYETEHGRIRVAKSMHVEQSVAVQPVQQSVAPSPVAPQADPAIHPGTVRSPMVGTIYLSPEPGAPTFVTVGMQVAQGQTLFIIESMKVMNPIKAKNAGCIKQIFVSDATPVEFNEPLLIIE